MLSGCTSEEGGFAGELQTTNNLFRICSCLKVGGFFLLSFGFLSFTVLKPERWLNPAKEQQQMVCLVCCIFFFSL